MNQKEFVPPQITVIELDDVIMAESICMSEEHVTSAPGGHPMETPGVPNSGENLPLPGDW